MLPDPSPRSEAESPLPGIVGEQPGHARGLPADAAGGADAGQRAARRRDRHRQGADRPRRPPAQPARRRPLRPRQLRRPDREPAGERAVRPRQGRVHRRHRQQDRPLRGGPRRHHLPRRNLQHEPQAAGQAAARACRRSEFERVGESRTIRVDTRVIAATNQFLEDEIEAGRFRDDLYYRLNVVPIYLPPLRERREDIPALARFFLERHSEENRRDAAGADAGRPRDAAGPRLAGQRPRAGELHRAGGGAVGRRAADAGPADAAGPRRAALAAAHAAAAAATCKA